MIEDVLAPPVPFKPAHTIESQPLQAVALSPIIVKCPQCKELLYYRDWEKNLKVCRNCEYHFRLTAQERINLLVDPGTFVETNANVVSADPLRFQGGKQSYRTKLEEECQKTGLNEAVVTGHAKIEGRPLALAVMDFRFIGGSMGSVVGEKITRSIELGIARHMPVLIVSASGGARMQEGLYALMQLAKTASALVMLAEAKLPCISLLTDPTTGGVTASFAMLGNVILAEPKALICFAGPRVIEQFMHVKLPDTATTSEAALQHGMIDAVVRREHLRPTLARLLRLYS